MSGEDQAAIGVLKSGLTDDPPLRWSATDLRAPVQEACRALDLSPVAAGALGRSLAAAVLLQRMTIKTSNRLVLAISGDGPLERIVAEVDSGGSIRGMVSAPHVEVPRSDPGALGVGQAIGSGVLRVWREQESMRYESQVQIHNGRIGEAVAHYLEQSEQTRSAVLLGALAESRGMTAVGGIMVEALPVPGNEGLDLFERHLELLPSISRTLAEEGLDGLIETVLGSTGVSLAETRTIVYRCRCSADSIGRFLESLDDEARQELRGANGVVEASCVFCGAVYRFDEDMFIH